MPISDLLAQITGEPSPTTSSFPKGRDPPQRSLDKAKKETTQTASPSKFTSIPRRASPVDSKAKSPANGTSHPSATAFKHGQPTPPPSNDPPKPPKKGSYAEIMARGQAAQKVLGQVGKIQHKKIERMPSKREREQLKAQRAGNIQKGLAPGSKFQRLGQSAVRGGQSGAKKSVKASTEHVPEKKVKKAALATTGYAGTARPKPGSNVCSTRPSPGSSSRDRGRYDDRRRSAYADEEEDDDEDAEPDYASDVSSDMEAAAFEVDEEEEMAARIARREDAEALNEENRLKREKEEKKRRLMAMAKKAKPISY